MKVNKKEQKSNPQYGEEILDMISTISCIFKIPPENIFLGGSRRFDYATSYSDYDFFILVDSEESAVKQIGVFGMEIESLAKSYTTEANIVAKMGQIHLIIFGNGDAWNNLKQEHQIIEKYLDNNSVIREYIGDLRARIDVSKIKEFGKYVYRSNLFMATKR